MCSKCALLSSHSVWSTLCESMDYSKPGLPVLNYFLEVALTHVHWVNDAIQPSHLLLPSIIPSIKVFSNELALHIRWPKYWSFSFSISPSNEYSGLFPLGWTGWIFFQSKGLKSLLQHHSSKASVLQHSAFLMVQLSHLYLTTGKTIALTIWAFTNKVVSLLFNMLSRLVIAFLPKSKCLLISWLQSLSTVILEPKKRKSVSVSTFPPSICHEVMGLDTMILVFWMLKFKPAFSLSSFTLIKRLFSSP